MTTLTLRDLGFVGGLGGYDTNALTYITAVETADGQALETATKDAINAFVVGCKSDGIWNAIKASCIMAGARTLAGALVPLVGTAPTNFNFVSGDYNRKTGLVGDGSTKYLNSNYAASNLGINNNHMSIYKSTLDTRSLSCYIGSTVGTQSAAIFGIYRFSAVDNTFNSSSSSDTTGLNPTGFVGLSRSNASGYQVRAANATSTKTRTSSVQATNNILIFSSPNRSDINSNARLPFYSIGESLDLALLDTRVSALITAIGAAF